MEPSNEIDVLEGWVGRSESTSDIMTAPWARLMQQTLDREATLVDGDPLPPLWHWIYFLSSVPISEVGRDGHRSRGGFLPPVALPRRMWAGGRLRFDEPIRIGDRVDKTSTISAVTMKQGSSGQLCFVTVTHELTVDGTTCVSEEQDLVYREDPNPESPAPASKPAPDGAQWQRTIEPSEVQLFRYSALTFNSHRIHYDRDYCRDVEGYPGLLFHGPFTATLLVDLAVSNNPNPLREFSFRAVAPLFDTETFTIRGRVDGESSIVWAETANGSLAMTAEAAF
ncbi:MAG: MaoC family dehydratase N-terminal domain-containing protein [Acidimicrobiales bacterium]